MGFCPGCGKLLGKAEGVPWCPSCALSDDFSPGHRRASETIDRLKAENERLREEVTAADVEVSVVKARLELATSLLEQWVDDYELPHSMVERTQRFLEGE